MIANDNGPPDGDFVRYIEGLTARPGSAPTTNTKSQTEAPQDKVAVHEMRGAVQAPSALPETQKRPLDPTVADAMARALMMRTAAGGAASSFADRYHWLLGAAGVIVLLYALFAPGLNLIAVLIGIALLNGFVKLRKRARDRSTAA